MENHTPTDCAVCAEVFTEIERKPITCPKCNYIVCKKCVQTFLISISDEPYCMNCRFGWNNTFLFENINKTFINTKLKKAKTLRTFETEKARFPESMIELEQFNEHKKLLKREDEFKQKSQDITQEITVLINKLNKLKEENTKWHNMIADIYVIKENLDNPLKVNNYFNTKYLTTQKSEVKREFKHPCPGKDCNGIMGRNWKCPVCETSACSKCFEDIGVVQIDNEHVCKKENIESANMIRTQTRSCPSCAVPIYKSSGCDQMWCTQCQVAFSWNTGKILKGIQIHNPHYFQALQAGNINIARNPGDQICGGLPDALQLFAKFKEICVHIDNYYYTTNAKYSAIPLTIHRTYTENGKTYIRKSPLFYEFLGYIMRNFIHNESVIIDKLRRQIQTNTDNSDIRMNYITKKITEEDFKRNLCNRNTKKYKTTESLQIIELFHTVCIDNMISIFDSKIDHTYQSKEAFTDMIMNKYIQNINNIRKYCNDQFDMFQKNNNLSSYYITDLFEIVTSHNKKNRIEEGN